VLVDRTRPGATIFKRMQRMARSGASLFVFPEGGRNDGALQPFKRGIFLLAIEHRLPIIPMTILGSGDVMPKGRLMVTPADVRVIIHDRIPTDSLGREDARPLAARVEAIIRSAMPGQL
jgi:1-acyl-sn-glycerol-3-phosphate acyltransferase